MHIAHIGIRKLFQKCQSFGAVRPSADAVVLEHGVFPVFCPACLNDELDILGKRVFHQCRNAIAGGPVLALLLGTAEIEENGPAFGVLQRSFFGGCGLLPALEVFLLLFLVEKMRLFFFLYFRKVLESR